MTVWVDTDRLIESPGEVWHIVTDRGAFYAVRFDWQEARSAYAVQVVNTADHHINEGIWSHTAESADAMEAVLASCHPTAQGVGMQIPHTRREGRP